MARRPVPIEVRFAAKVDRSGGPDACHPWGGYTTKEGYGQIGTSSGSPLYTHRLAWEVERGPIPDGLLVRHFICGNPPCCNVRHLALGSDKDNSDDCYRHGRGLTGIRWNEQTGRQVWGAQDPDHLAKMMAALPRGEAASNARLTAYQVLAIRRRAAEGEPNGALAAAYGTSHQNVSNIVGRKTWKHV